jgi:hypothetical protein
MHNIATADNEYALITQGLQLATKLKLMLQKQILQ